MADQKITDLTEATLIDGTEYVEVVQSGSNKKVPTSLISVTREINRTWTDTLLFDKHEITYAPKTMDDDINFVVGAGGLVDQFSAARMRIITDGIHAINFTSDFNFIYGITNGQIVEAGTYQIYFLYLNGSVTVTFPGVSAEQSGLVALEAPANFAAVADGETEIDLSWDDVANESSYLIEFSLDGLTGWTTLAAPAANATTSNQTGLSAGVTRFYRIKAVGDGVSFSDSAYSTASATTESGGDVDAPEFTFLPASGNTVWPVNKVITITADEAIRNTDGSEITNANVASRITLKETNSGGSNIAFTATIDVSKTVITITPNPQYGDNQLVYVAINNVEDVNGNEVTVAVSSTFTTTEHTFFNGSSNRLVFGDILDSLFAAGNAVFNLKCTVNNALLSGQHMLWAKFSPSDNQRSFLMFYDGTNVAFNWYRNGIGSQHRSVQWAGALSSGEHTLELQYDGGIDTNDGLDRVTLLVDGSPAGSKTMASSAGTLGDIFSSSAQLCFGSYVNSAGTPGTSSNFTEEAKDLIVESSGPVVEINVPIIRIGTDTSGNGRNGTWV